jgi:3-keto-disaccharide hydrolase
METRFTAASTSLFPRKKLNQLCGMLTLALAGCATATSPPPKTPISPPPNVSAPKSPPMAPVDSAKLDALFPVGQPRPLFDNTSLRGWQITDFAGHGDVAVDKNIKGTPAIVFEPGAALTGVTWTNAIPHMDYEVELDAIKLLGSDFFCGVTFPFGDSFCTFICGGWGGAVVGISSVDGEDASLNETTKYVKFDENRWYHIKVRVTKARIEAWVDSDKMVDLDTAEKKISMRLGEIEESEPFGIASYQTRAALRNLTLRRLIAGK